MKLRPLCNFALRKLLVAAVALLLWWAFRSFAPVVGLLARSPIIFVFLAFGAGGNFADEPRPMPKTRYAVIIALIAGPLMAALLYWIDGPAVDMLSYCLVVAPALAFVFLISWLIDGYLSTPIKDRGEDHTEPA